MRVLEQYLPDLWWDRALFYGDYADCCAGIEFAGLPMDAEKVGVLQDIALRSLGVKSLKIAVVFK